MKNIIVEKHLVGEMLGHDTLRLTTPLLVKEMISSSLENKIKFVSPKRYGSEVEYSVDVTTGNVIQKSINFILDKSILGQPIEL